MSSSQSNQVKDQQSTGTSERTGGCACGRIRYRITAPLMMVGVCHCTDCQKASGGGPNYVAVAPRDAFEVIAGDDKVGIYCRKGDSGEDVQRMFCAACGTPLWSQPPAGQPFIPVKMGSLDDHSDLTPQMHIYARSAPAWHQMNDGLPQFPGMPPAPPSAV